MSLRLPPVSDTASGIPCASVIRWCFEPGRARSTGLGPVLGRPSAPAHGSCQSPPATSQRAGGVQLRQQRLVQLLPHPGLLPVPQPPPAGHPRPEPQLLGQELPRDAVYRTNKMPHSTLRSSSRLRPG